MEKQIVSKKVQSHYQGSLKDKPQEEFVSCIIAGDFEINQKPPTRVSCECGQVYNVGPLEKGIRKFCGGCGKNLIEVYEKWRNENNKLLESQKSLEYEFKQKAIELSGLGKHHQSSRIFDLVMKRKAETGRLSVFFELIYISDLLVDDQL